MRDSRDAPRESAAPLTGRLLRSMGVLAAACALVVVLALECDFYGALAEGRAVRFDGGALRELLVSAGMDGRASSP